MIDWTARLDAWGSVWHFRPGGAHVVHQLDGFHAAGYFNSDVITSDERALASVSEGLADLFQNYDFVVAPRSAITAGAEMAASVARRRGLGWTAFDLVSNAFVVPVPARARVLVITDDVHGGSSAARVIRALRADRTVEIVGAAAVVNFSSLDQIEGVPLRALTTMHFQKWRAEECELCRAGSPARPARSRGDKR